MDYKVISAEEAGLTNYPAYCAHYQPLLFSFYKRGRQTIIFVFPTGQGDTASYIQCGSPEYINGWLYGAVQAACGQCRPNVPLQEGKLVSIAMENHCVEDAASRIFIYTGSAFSPETVRAELFRAAKELLDDEGVYNWDDFFSKYGAELADCGFTELNPSDDWTDWPTLRINGVIPIGLDCGSSLSSLVDGEYM